jgi:hypothetical protein
MKSQITKALGLISLSLSFLNASAQTEYLVKVDATTGVYNKIKNLPGVNWIWTAPYNTTFDEINHRYIFKGSPDQVNWHLYSVDAVSGNIISSPSFPVLTDSADNVIELQFDNSSNILYGLHWDNSENKEYLVSIDPATGSFTKIKNLLGVKWIMPGNTAFDKTNHHYVFKGADDSLNWYLYTVDATTGNIVSNPPYPASSSASTGLVMGLQYDNSLHKYYGLTWDDSENKEYLVNVDPTTGLFTRIGVVQGLTSMLKTTYDETNHRYIVVGPDSGGIWHLNSLDVNTANTISSPSFPELSSSMDNVIEFQYDNSSATLYALRWDPNNTTAISNNQSHNQVFNLYPNPFSYSLRVVLDKPYREITIFMYDALGRVVKQQKTHNASTVDIQRNDLSSGTYFISIICEHQNMGTQKIIIE